MPTHRGDCKQRVGPIDSASQFRVLFAVVVLVFATVDGKQTPFTLRKVE